MSEKEPLAREPYFPDDVPPLIAEGVPQVILDGERALRAGEANINRHLREKIEEDPSQETQSKTPDNL